MRKNVLLFFVVFGFIASTTGCTSKKVDQESTDAMDIAEDSQGGGAEGADEISELGDEFGSELEGAPADGEAPSSGDDFATDGNSLDEDTALNQEGGDSFDTFSNQEDTSPSGTDDQQGLQELATNENGAMDSALPPETADSYSDSLGDSSLADSSLAGDETQGLSEEYTEPAPKPMIPLQKMITTPYRQAGVVVNSLYVARPGDSLESVSQKIYGQDRTAELKKINPTFARRDMKVGDKVYHNSPQRPDDDTTVLAYYEDKGLAPEVYMSQPGDNIRVVAKSLLGHANSWKEIWATNPDVESKGDLPEGTRLRYWSDVGGMPIAAAPVAEPTPPAEPPPMMESSPPPMPDDVAMQPPMEAAPPPPEPIMAEPPPPPPMAEAQPPPFQNAEDAASTGDDPDQMMALGAGAILLVAAIALFIIIRKKRARRGSGIDFHTATHTQIE